MSILEVRETVAEAVLVEVPTASAPSTATATAQAKTVDPTHSEVCEHLFEKENVLRATIS